ncbi:MerR family transcriptional regulator [Nocardia thailandica]|uniref:MerR family transcriptional regulator n=1 Tax=Nocardia thailandica TaxID=257275 RepID=UPI0002FC1F4D|nr:MerR family transcriptional regulator [Nocardia thailandica]
MTENTRVDQPVSIGELARTTGLSVRTIRFYCDEGLLESRRSSGGHRIFEQGAAVDRVLLVRRLRAFGLGLDSISAVLSRERSLDEVLAAESERVDQEFRSLAWRRASLRAVASVAAVDRPGRLALLAVAQDANAVHDCLIQFWHRILAPLPRAAGDAWVCWNVPEPPADPAAEQVVAFAELVALANDEGMKAAVRHQYWRSHAEQIRDPFALFSAMGDLMVDVVPLVANGTRPRGGRELDRFVGLHAHARGQRDTAEFRTQLLAAATDTDDRIHRYWDLTEDLLPGRVTIGRAHDWLYRALAG